jgi:hypothetical protein
VGNTGGLFERLYHVLSGCQEKVKQRKMVELEAQIHLLDRENASHPSMDKHKKNTTFFQLKWQNLFSVPSISKMEGGLSLPNVIFYYWAANLGAVTFLLAWYGL